MLQATLFKQLAIRMWNTMLYAITSFEERIERKVR